LVLGCVGNMDELYLSFSALVSGRIYMVAKKHETDIIMIVTIHICMQSCGKAIYTLFWYLLFSFSVPIVSAFLFILLFLSQCY